MGNSRRKKKIIKVSQAAYQKRIGQTVADAAATARRVIATTRDGLEAAKGIRIRPLKQRDASHAAAADTKSSLEAACTRMRRHALLPISLSGILKTV